MQACFELNMPCFGIRGPTVYYSGRAVSWTAGNHVSIPYMDKRFFSSPKDIRHFFGPAEPHIHTASSGGSFALDKAAGS